RKRKPLPKMFLHATDARSLGLAAGDWAEAETRTGKMKAMVEIRADMPRGLVRVPHGWWLPETSQGREHLSSAWNFADGQLCRDGDLCDDLGAEEFHDLLEVLCHRLPASEMAALALAA